MLTSRWQPFTSMWGEVSRLHDEMNRLFSSYGIDDGWPGLAVAYPAVNVREDGDNLYVEAELPGLGQDDLEIYVSGGNLLTLKGERRAPQVDGVWHRQERGFGSFSRVIELPADVDADKVEAAFLDGVMTVTLPKSETAKPKKIAVKAE